MPPLRTQRGFAKERTMIAFACWLAGAALAAPIPHDPGLSSLRVVRLADATVLHLACNNADFAAALGAEADGDGDGRITAAELQQAQPRLAELLPKELRLAGSAAGTLSGTAIAENDDVELILRFAAAPLATQVEAALLARFSRGHRCYAAEVVELAAPNVIVDALLRPTDCVLDLAAMSADAVPSGFRQFGQFLWLGIEHILIGFDHLAFLLALLAGGLARRQILATITAFTVAHSITLLAAAGGWLTLPGLFVEATIAGSIVVVALLNLVRSRSAHRLPLAFAFGLIHGFGFAGVVADLGIGGADRIWPVLTFNIGVELGQLAFAAVAVPILTLLGRRFRTMPVRNWVSIATGLAGLWWLGERLAG
jgi:hypothetical protein